MMKKLILILAILSTSTSFAFEKDMRVVDRVKKFKAKIVTRTLVDLESDKAFDGKYFKIVFKKSDDPISFDVKEEIRLKAATTYYHLNKARKYYVETLKSDYVKSFPKLTIRIEITNKFNDLGHFSHDNLDPQYNNALSIPNGDGFEPRGVKPWGKEIWFRPVKRVHVDELGGTKQDAQALKYSLRSFRNSLHMSTFKRFLSNLITGDVYRSGATPLENVMRTAGATIIMEGIYQTSGAAASFFARKWYKLDSALVPEVIYHEFSHIALSDHIKISHSTPVNEGLADFFAGKIANSEQLATKIKKYNLFSGKKVKRKAMYREEFEQRDYANTDFVFGLLWEASSILSDDKVVTSGERKIYGMRSLIDSDDTIKNQLLEGILTTCTENCATPRVTKYKLYKLFHYKGL